MALIAIIIFGTICLLVLGNLAVETPQYRGQAATPAPQITAAEPLPGYVPEEGPDVRIFSDAEVQNLIRIRPDEVVIEASGAVRWREWRGEKQFDGSWRCVRWR